MPPPKDKAPYIEGEYGDEDDGQGQEDDEPHIEDEPYPQPGEEENYEYGPEDERSGDIVGAMTQE